jgi:hypothetical protein
VLVVLAGVVVAAAVTDEGPTAAGDHLGGDYPAFYAAGELARSGDWEDLYDGAEQQAAQRGLLGDDAFLYFAYPPPVAAAYAPLSAVDYRWSYLIHTGLMAAALWGAVRLAAPFHPAVRRHPAVVFAALLLTYPMWRAVTGGQNTALTLLLIVAAAHYDRRGDWIGSGLAVGLLLYKPQFGLLFFALLILRRRWRSAAVATGVAAAMGVASTAVLGVDWLDDWLSPAREFARLNAELNSANLISLPGALGDVLGTAGDVVGWVLAGLLAGGTAVVLARRPDLDAVAAFGLTAAAAILVLPQPLFYELGLASTAALWLVTTRRAARVAIVLAAVTWFQAASGDLGGLPSLAIAVITMGVAAARVRVIGLRRGVGATV